MEVTARLSEDAPADDEGSMFGVRCLSSDNVSEAIVYLIVTVDPVFSMDVEMGSDDELEVLPGASETFSVNVTNTGNTGDTYTFELGRHSDHITAVLSGEEMDLEAGETGEVLVTVTPGEDAPAGRFEQADSHGD